MKKKKYSFLLIIILLFSCGIGNDKFESFEVNERYIWFRNSDIRLRIDNDMFIKVYFREDKMGQSLTISEPNEFLSKPPQYIMVNGKEIKNFRLTDEKPQVLPVSNKFGIGRRLIITGVADEPDGLNIEKRLIIELYDKFPDTALMYTVYKNLSRYRTATVERAYTKFRVDASLVSKVSEPDEFWSFHGISKYNWIEKITPDFSRDNYTGTSEVVETGSAKTTGQGIPLIDLWTKKMGMAVALIEPQPRILSFPVKTEYDNSVSMGALEEPNVKLKPQEKYQTYKYAVIVHELDCFNPLKRFRELMNSQGYNLRSPPKSAYLPFWSTLGIGENYTSNDVYNKLSELKELGIGWVILDKEWFDRFGDWHPDKKKFNSGEKSIKEIVYLIHESGLNVMLWWVPLSSHEEAVISREHPDWFILDNSGKKEESGWGAFYLCPALNNVKNYTAGLVRKFISEWGIDGFYFEGACLNSVPFCYAGNHAHSSPTGSLVSLSEYFKTIYETAVSLKPDFVIKLSSDEVCPSLYNLFQFNSVVVGEPKTRFQLRNRIKALKGLLGAKFAVDGNYYEKNTWDFASYIAPGGILSLKFTSLKSTGENESEKVRSDILKLRGKIYNRWFKIYNNKKLYNGEYLNLYNMGFDKPEAHVVKKGERIYYSFFSPFWEGEIELRGLEKRKYQLIDYVHNIDLGNVKGPKDNIKIRFKEFLLLEAVPR